VIGRRANGALPEFTPAGQDTRILETALRVLAACAYRRAPDETEVAYLRQCTADTLTPPDELSRKVIQGVLKTNRARRNNGDGV